MATRTFEGTQDTFISSGAEITYKGDALPGSTGDLSQRAFLINPASTGDIIVTLDRSEGIETMEIFQDDNYTAGNSPTGYQKFFNVIKAGRGKGAVGVTVTDASKNYLVILTIPDAYSEVSYNGSVVVPWALAGLLARCHLLQIMRSSWSGGTLPAGSTLALMSLFHIEQIQLITFGLLVMAARRLERVSSIALQKQIKNK